MTFFDYLGLVFVAGGVVFFAIDVFGLFKFKYVLNRMHAGAIGDSFAFTLVMIGLMFISGWNMTSLKLFIALVLLLFSSPVCAHLVVQFEAEVNDKLEEECEVDKECRS